MVVQLIRAILLYQRWCEFVSAGLVSRPQIPDVRDDVGVEQERDCPPIRRLRQLWISTPMSHLLLTPRRLQPIVLRHTVPADRHCLVLRSKRHYRNMRVN